MQVKMTNLEDMNRPPPAIGSDRVIAYAVIDKDVRYTGEQRLYAGDKLIGRVPRIAICKSLQKGMSGHLILFCSKSWRVLGIASANSLAAAKKEVERHYIGLADKWIAVNTSEKTAKHWLAEKYPQDVCHFCGQLSYEVEAMFPSPKAVICSSCVEAFSEELRRKDEQRDGL